MKKINYADNTVVNFVSADEVFDKIHIEDLHQLLNLTKQFDKDVNVSELLDDFASDNTKLQEACEAWEKSVISGNPDFSLYNFSTYMNESFLCWKLYSRRYLLLLRKYLNREDCEIDKDSVHTILDIGCGCAYSTLGLKSIFKDASVVATNLADSVQHHVCKAVCENIDGIEIYDETRTFVLPNKPDIVFASEFFEHLSEPITFLLKLIEAYNPKYFIVANTFTQMATGHFKDYYDEYGNILSGKEMSRYFYKTLRAHGYKAVQTGFFNNRPRIFKRIDSNTI